MLRFAGLALAAGIALPAPALPQEAPSVQRAYGFSSITDTSHAKATIWASPVFPVEVGADDAGGIQRSFDLADEFLAYVGTLGGQGNKQCVVTATQQDAAASREEQRSIWDKRMYMVKIGNWREVAWTPAPWTPAQASAKAMPATRYFLLPGRRPAECALSRTVATAVLSGRCRRRCDGHLRTGIGVFEAVPGGGAGARPARGRLLLALRHDGRSAVRLSA